MLPPDAAPSAACYGKLPSRGDFVRHHGGGRGLEALDAWLQRGVLHAQRAAGRALDQASDEAPATAFVFDPPAGAHILAGALRPSRDLSGRRFPFVVAVEVPRNRVEGRRLPCWPARYQAFFAEAVALVTDAVGDALPPDALPERLRQLRARFDATSFLVDYEYRLRQQAAAAVWDRIWGGRVDGRPDAVLHWLAGAFRRAGGRPPAEPLRLPLPVAPDPLAPMLGNATSFWLEAYWRHLGRPPDRACFFWQTSAEAPGHLFIAADVPPAALYADLVGLGAGTVALPVRTSAPPLPHPGPPMTAEGAAEPTLWNLLQQL